MPISSTKRAKVDRRGRIEDDRFAEDHSLPVGWRQRGFADPEEGESTGLPLDVDGGPFFVTQDLVDGDGCHPTVEKKGLPLPWGARKSGIG